MKTTEELYNSRFEYNSGLLYDTIGREEELRLLTSFLDNESDAPRFRWWAIVGPGGSGKSRLALTFAEQLPAGWTCIKPRCIDNRLSFPEPTTNTLYIVDYAQAYIQEIGKWIKQQSSSPGNFKIRLLMLERDNGDWTKRLLQCIRGIPLAETARFKEDFLKIQPLDDEQTLLLMSEYASAATPLSNKYTRSWQGDTIGIELLDALKLIDPDMQRPLFALFLTDSWLLGEEPAHWNREKLLGTIIDREERHIYERMQESVHSPNPDILVQSAQSLLRFATVLGDASQEDLEKHEPISWKILDDTAHSIYLENAISLMSQIGLGNDDIVFAMRPDILGEYYILRWLQNYSNDEQRKTFFNSIWSFPSQAASFLYRFITDFSDIIDKTPDEWERVFFYPTSTITIDNSIHAFLLSCICLHSNNIDTITSANKQLNIFLEKSPEQQTIAFEYAASLVLLIRQQTSIEDATSTLDSLRALFEKYPDNQDIAEMYANGSFLLFCKQDTGNATILIDTLESLTKAFPNNTYITNLYQKAIIFLLRNQSPQEALISLQRLDSLTKIHNMDQDCARMLSHVLSLLIAKQDSNEATTTIKRLEDLSNQYPDDLEIAHTYGQGLYLLSCKQNTPNAAQTLILLDSLITTYHLEDQDLIQGLASGLLKLSIQPKTEETDIAINRLTNLYNAYSNNPKVVNTYAKGIALYTDKQGKKEIAATVEKLETLSDLYPDDNDISEAFSYAFIKLYNQVPSETSITQSHIKETEKCGPATPDYTLSLSKGIITAISNQDAQENTKTANQMNKLLQIHPNNAGLVFVFSYVLLVLSLQQSPEQASETINQLQTLMESHPENLDCVANYAKGLTALIKRQDPNDAYATIKKIEELVTKHPENREITISHANALASLASNQDPTEITNTLKQLESLADLYPDEQELVQCLATVLVFLSVKQETKDALQTLNRIREISHTHADNENLAEKYAYGLFILFLNQDPNDVAYTIEQIKELSNKYPNNKAIMEVFSKIMETLP